MDEYRNDIEKYLRGELTPAEMYALERKALNDPFLADALEGAQQLDAAELEKDIAELNREIGRRKRPAWVIPARMAAAIAVVAISVFFIQSLLDKPSQQDLAYEPRTTLPQNPAAQTETAQEATPQLPVVPQPTEEQKPGNTTRQPQARNKKTVTPTEPVTSAPRESTRVPNLTASKNQFPQGFIKLDTNKRNEIWFPSASEIRLAEGYIATLDAKPVVITGIVTSAEDGLPLPDVNVLVKGTNAITKTDARGQYAIMAQGNDKTLVYSSVGLESTEVKVNGIDSTYLPVKLVENEDAKKQSAVEASDRYGWGATNVYTIPPHPETGNRAFKQYLQNNIRYPQEAIDKKVSGVVLIEFKVDLGGALSEFKILRGIGSGCDEELIRAILQGTKWKPATIENEPVVDKARVRFKFELKN